MTNRTAIADLPTWDLSVFYPSLDSEEFTEAFAKATKLTDELVELFDRQHIGAAAVLDEAVVAESFERVIQSLDELLDHLETLGAYLYSTMSVDTRDEAPQIKMSELEQHLVELAKLSPRLSAWLGEIDVEALLANSAVARDHEYLVRRGRIEAAHLMSPAEESLAAELRTSSGSTWSRLYDNVAAQIMTTIELDGDQREIAMPKLRLLSLDSNREVRERAFQAELGAWEAHEVPIAAALNGIKGESLTLTRRRRWKTPLDLALFRNGIDRDILDAMLAAAGEFFPDAREYFHAKAGLLGLDRLAWFDLFAPLPGDETSTWTFARSCGLIQATFDDFSPRLGGMARRAFAERWIDALPRPGKSDGAYCIPLRRDISRVFMNFTPSYMGASTLAHELGHAYHNVAIGHRPGTQRESPSTLAETASIFCETLIRHSAVKSASPREELSILEGTLQDATQTIVDITSRFLFEQRLFERRRESDVSISELRELMTDAQRETYGDGLEEDAHHPYMWAAKGHYYSVDESFYNFPYMFGMLFGLGLYQRFREQPSGFTERYDDLLSSTGRADASELAARFDLDLRSIDFWRSSLDVVRTDIRRYLDLANLTASSQVVGE